MRKPLIAIAFSLLALAACHLSPHARNATAERLFVTALNAVFRVASSDLLPDPPITPRPRCEMTRTASASVAVAAERKTKDCAKSADQPTVLRSGSVPRAVTF